MNHNWVEYVGYLASVFIIGSFLTSKVRTIRIINFFGCVCFVIYGIYNGLLWPVIIPNGILALVQVYHIFFKKSN
nr:uroporphyrinogen decarboxylase [Soonwooa sp.]